MKDFGYRVIASTGRGYCLTDCILIVRMIAGDLAHRQFVFGNGTDGA